MRSKYDISIPPEKSKKYLKILRESLKRNREVKVGIYDDIKVRKLYYTIAEAAKAWGVSETLLRNLIENGRIVVDPTEDKLRIKEREFKAKSSLFKLEGEMEVAAFAKVVGVPTSTVKSSMLRGHLAGRKARQMSKNQWKWFIQESELSYFNERSWKEGLELVMAVKDLKDDGTPTKGQVKVTDKIKDKIEDKLQMEEKDTSNVVDLRETVDKIVDEKISYGSPLFQRFGMEDQEGKEFFPNMDVDLNEVKPIVTLLSSFLQYPKDMKNLRDELQIVKSKMDKPQPVNDELEKMIMELRDEVKSLKSDLKSSVSTLEGAFNLLRNDVDGMTAKITDRDGIYKDMMELAKTKGSVINQHTKWLGDLERTLKIIDPQTMRNDIRNEILGDISARLRFLITQKVADPTPVGVKDQKLDNVSIGDVPDKPFIFTRKDASSLIRACSKYYRRVDCHTMWKLVYEVYEKEVGLDLQYEKHRQGVTHYLDVVEQVKGIGQLCKTIILWGFKTEAQHVQIKRFHECLTNMRSWDHKSQEYKNWEEELARSILGENRMVV